MSAIGTKQTLLRCNMNVRLVLRPQVIDATWMSRCSNVRNCPLNLR